MTSHIWVQNWLSAPCECLQDVGIAPNKHDLGGGYWNLWQITGRDKVTLWAWPTIWSSGGKQELSCSLFFSHHHPSSLHLHILARAPHGQAIKSVYATLQHSCWIKAPKPQSHFSYNIIVIRRLARVETREYSNLFLAVIICQILEVCNGWQYSTVV